jgi:hypothetical protein
VHTITPKFRWKEKEATYIIEYGVKVKVACSVFIELLLYIHDPITFLQIRVIISYRYIKATSVHITSEPKILQMH